MGVQTSLPLCKLSQLILAAVNFISF